MTVKLIHRCNAWHSYDSFTLRLIITEDTSEKTFHARMMEIMKEDGISRRKTEEAFQELLQNGQTYDLENKDGDSCNYIMTELETDTILDESF